MDFVSDLKLCIHFKFIVYLILEFNSIFRFWNLTVSSDYGSWNLRIIESSEYGNLNFNYSLFFFVFFCFFVNKNKHVFRKFKKKNYN